MSEEKKDLVELEKENIKNSIKKEPVNGLKESLNFYTKDKIFDLAKDHDDHISKSNLKAEMIDLAEEIILKNLEKDYEKMTEKERSVINKVFEDKDLSQEELSESENFKKLGYVYWFYDKKEIKVVMPDEIKEKYKAKKNHKILEEIPGEKEVKNENKLERVEKSSELENKILNHIKALKEIYGIFEVNQVIEVWKKYNKEILEKDYLYEILEGLEKTESDFWWSSPYIVSKDFKGKEEYEEFLKTRMGKKYYIPTKAEMNYYMRHEFQMKNRYYRRIENYFKEHGNLKEESLNELMDFIELSCRVNNTFKDVLKKITSSGFIFKNQNELNKMIKNYSNLNNNTRKWNLKGFKPVELTVTKAKKKRSQQVNPTSRKIGRNELCPCGSGKKYKFCCID